MGNGFLPAAYQGTLFRNGDTPIVDLNRRPGISEAEQRRELDLLRAFNEKHRAERTQTSELDARIASFELAFRMQARAPELVDLKASRMPRRSYTAWMIRLPSILDVNACSRGAWWNVGFVL